MRSELVLKVVDALRVPGRTDLAVVVESVTGSLWDIEDGVYVSDSGERWRMTAVATSQPGAERLTVGFERIGAGPDLVVGELLVWERCMKPKRP